jgi:hypothetical protein
MPYSFCLDVFTGVSQNTRAGEGRGDVKVYRRWTALLPAKTPGSNKISLAKARDILLDVFTSHQYRQKYQNLHLPHLHQV